MSQRKISIQCSLSVSDDKIVKCLERTGNYEKMKNLSLYRMRGSTIIVMIKMIFDVIWINEYYQRYKKERHGFEHTRVSGELFLYSSFSHLGRMYLQYRSLCFRFCPNEIDRSADLLMDLVIPSSLSRAMDTMFWNVMQNVLRGLFFK